MFAARFTSHFLLITAGMVLIMIFLPACNQLSVKKSLEGLEYQLVDQNNRKVVFPETFSGKVMLVGYVYTHCPDICPLITYNMRDIQRALPDAEDFMLVSISFDPDRDTPEILYNYAQNYRLNQDNWRMLTGEKGQIESLLEVLEISTLKTPTRFLDDQTPLYFIDHSDRVTLIDGNGNIRRHYQGSEMDAGRIITDIKTLLLETKT